MGGRMRALAELIMRGRAAAIAVAVIACAVPMMFWLSAAAVALVTLRRGWHDGLQVFIWALLPAGAWAWMGQPSALFCLVGTMAMAYSLRRTASWPVALMTLVPAGALMALVISDYYAPQVAHAMDILRQLYGPNLETLFPEGANLSQEQILTLLETSFVRTASFIIAGGAVLALILARGWQAMLYNPGGFRTEFHRLRLTPVVTVVLLGLWLLAMSSTSLVTAAIQPVLLMPLLVAGIALMHGLAGLRGFGKAWLLPFYVLLLAFYPVVVLLACLDSLLDFRGRLENRMQG